MKRFYLLFILGLLVTSSVWAQGNDRAALRGAIGPSFTFLASFDLDETTFTELGNFTDGFDITDASNDKAINGNMLTMVGFEGFGEVTPHWTVGMYAGQGEYLSHSQDAQDVDFSVIFTLNQVGVTAELNTHARSRLNLLAGSMAGIGQATLSASSSPENEDWVDIISGNVPRKAFTVSSWNYVIQPYLGARFDISRSMGFKVATGYSLQKADSGSWRLYHSKVISTSREFSMNALFFRLQLFVLL